MERDREKETKVEREREKERKGEREKGRKGEREKYTHTCCLLQEVEHPLAWYYFDR